MGIRSWFKRRDRQEETPEIAAAQAEETEEIQYGEEDDSDPLYEETVVIEEAAPAAFEIDEIIEAEPKPLLADFDVSDFWHDTRESDRRHKSAPFDHKLLREIEEELGFRLPASYTELMKMHNGGLVNRCWFQVSPEEKSYLGYVQITGFLGIGREMLYSLCGRFGSRFLLDSRAPDADVCGVAISNVISPARGLILLDYEACENEGEPCVSYLNTDTGEKKIIAPCFEAFVRTLRASAAEYEA